MGAIRMSVKERIRLESFGRVKRGELTVVDAAGLVGLSACPARRRESNRSKRGRS